MVTGRVLEPDQSKRPPHAAQHKNPCSVVGCTAKAKASLLCKTKTKKDTGKWWQVRCKKPAKKVVRAVPALQHACCPQQMCTCAPTTVRTGSTQPGGAKSLQHTETKKGFLSRVPKKTKRPAPAPGCSNVLQARGVCCNTHTAHGFCAIDGCVTGAGKDGLCTKHVLPLSSAL